MIFPAVPTIPKLHKNKKTASANTPISTASFLIALSMGLACLVLLPFLPAPDLPGVFFRPDPLLFLCPDAISHPPFLNPPVLTYIV
jgi:hypothetical protein